MDTIVEPTGSFGRFQKINLGIVGCITMLSAMYYNLIIINYFEPDIKCHVKNTHVNSSIFDNDRQFTKCEMWNDYTQSLSSDTQSPFICKLDNSTYGSNIIIEWDLVCKNNYIATITQSLYLVGSLCAFLTEFIVNKYGRRKTSVIFILSLISVAVLTQALMSDIKMLSVKDHLMKFAVYILGQLILGVLVYCLSGSSYLHLIELTTSTYHRFFSNVNVFFYMLGELFCLGVYFITLNWRMTNWFLILFAIITFAIFNFFVLESPRWLIESAQYEEAYEILKKIARFNKKKTLDSPKFKDYLLKQMQTNLDDKSRENSDLEDQLDSVNSRPKIQDIKELSFSKRICVPKDNFIKVTLLIVLFNCLSINFFGLSLSIVNATQINKFIIVALSSLFGFLGALACMMNKKIGYKSALLNFLILSGLTSMLVVVIPDQVELNWLVIIKAGSSLVSKASIVASYNTAVIFASELYDRKIKMDLIVLLNCAGCIMTITTPQIDYLRYFWHPLPFVIYTTATVISFMIVNTFPEPRSLQKKKNLNYM